MSERAHEFHEKFGQPASKYLVTRDPNLVRFRARLIREEYEEVMAELAKLCHKDNFFDAYPTLLDLAKELADLQTIIEGTAVTFGIDLDAVHAEVHRSNMTKTPDPAGGKPSKGQSYSCANVERALGYPLIDE